MLRKLIYPILIIVIVVLGGYLLSIKMDDWNASQIASAPPEQVTIHFAVTVPPETPRYQKIFLAGDAKELGTWRAEGLELKKGDDNKYHATIRLPGGVPIEYKVTRGSWNSVERGPDGIEIDNRTLNPTKTEAIDFAVDTWVDQGKAEPGKSTASGDIRMHVGFHSTLLNNERTLAVYLPPNYDQNTDQRYPVLYMQDGQNIFDTATSFAGVEWNADETAQKLINDGSIKPVIIVGIYNTPDRTEEYTPWQASETDPVARGVYYGWAVAYEVKRFIDSTYRTLPDRDNTAIAGSSLGGLIALDTARAHNDTFGACAALSPSLWSAQGELLSQWTADHDWMKGTRFWIDMGEGETDDYPTGEAIPHLQTLIATLQSAGLTKGNDFQSLVAQGDDKNEAAWSKRFAQVLTFLYGN
jgi:predicted alpha/beta superfamily hydrolase